MYKYYVVTQGESGITTWYITRPFKLNTQENIEAVTKDLQKEKECNLLIINFWGLKR